MLYKKSADPSEEQHSLARVWRSQRELSKEVERPLSFMGMLPRRESKASRKNHNFPRWEGPLLEKTITYQTGETPLL
jgi:hypothetical protein